MRPNRTPPPYVAKAMETARIAAATPGGIDVHFSSRSEANQNRMRFYQARKALLRINPEDTSDLATVETKIADTRTGALLHIQQAGAGLFTGVITATETGEVIDTTTIREAKAPVINFAKRDARLTRETVIMDEIWQDPFWADEKISGEAREEELARRLAESE